MSFCMTGGLLKNSVGQIYLVTVGWQFYCSALFKNRIKNNLYCLKMLGTLNRLLNQIIWNSYSFDLGV